MPNENVPIGEGEVDGLESVEGVTGDDLGLAPDVFTDPEPETSPEDADLGTDGELSQTGDEDQDVASDVTDDPQPEQVTEATGQDESFYRYGQTEFKNKESLDNFIRSNEGRLRKANYDYNDALTKNKAWQNWANDPQKIREHLASLEGTSPEEVKTTGEKKTFLTGTDWKTLQSLVQQGRGMEALAAMADMYDGVVDSRLAELENKLSSQIQPVTQQQEAVQYTTNLMRSAANTMDNDGNYIWPEFNRNSGQFDPQFCQLFTRVWEQLPANIAWDENLHGIEVAYNRTKQVYAQAQRQNATGNPGNNFEGNNETHAAQNRAATAARDAQGRFVKQTEDAVTAIGGSGHTPSPTKGPASSFQDAAILRGMDRAGDDRDEVFGIRR